MTSVVFVLALLYQGSALGTGSVEPPAPAPVETPAPAPVEEPAPAATPEPALSPAARAVADCESGARLSDGSAVEGSADYRAENPHSSASGAYQFVDATWEWVTGLPAPASAHPPAVQDAAFESLWDGGAGAHHWNPSRSCWERKVNP